MSNPDKTAVIIVNFNGKKTLDHCLDSLQCQSFSNFKTIVVDNGSNDNSTEVPLQKKTYRIISLVVI